MTTGGMALLGVFVLFAVCGLWVRLSANAKRDQEKKESAE